MDAANRTRYAVSSQLRAMGVALFEVGVYHRDKGMIIRRWRSSEILSAVSWLRHMNATGHHIYVRPAHSLGVVLLDDLTREACCHLHSSGLPPAVVTQTSPGNFQCWIRLIHNVDTKPIDPALIRIVSLTLAKSYGGDLNSADWRHFGRLAGFTNRKYQEQPFVLLEQATGIVAPKGRSLLLTAAKNRVTKPPQVSAAKRPGAKPKMQGPGYAARLQRLLEINANMPWASSPDWSRIDFMIARDLHRQEVPDDCIEQVLLESPDLHLRKGSNALDYVRRTIQATNHSFLPPDPQGQRL